MPSQYRTVLHAYVQPKGQRHFKTPAVLNFRDKAEQKAQLAGYVRSKWPRARRIDIDLNSQEVVVDGVPVANFALYSPGARPDNAPTLDLQLTPTTRTRTP